MTAKVQFSGQRTFLIIQRQSTLMFQYHFVRDMGEDKKVLLVKVDTLKNTVDALKKYVSSENLS